MEIPAEALRQLSAPRVVNDDHRAYFRRLNNSLCLAAIFHALRRAFDQQNIDRPLVVVVATLDKGK